MTNPLISVLVIDETHQSSNHFVFFLSCRFSDKEVQKDTKLFPFKIVNKDEKPYIQVKIKDGETKVFSPEEISAMVLTKMKETAEAFIGKTIKDAVVTVPGNVKKNQKPNRLNPWTKLIPGLFIV